MGGWGEVALWCILAQVVVAQATARPQISEGRPGAGTVEASYPNRLVSPPSPVPAGSRKGVPSFYRVVPVSQKPAAGPIFAPFVSPPTYIVGRRRNCTVPESTPHRAGMPSDLALQEAKSGNGTTPRSLTHPPGASAGCVSSVTVWAYSLCHYPADGAPTSVRCVEIHYLREWSTWDRPKRPMRPNGAARSARSILSAPGLADLAPGVLPSDRPLSGGGAWIVPAPCLSTRWSDAHGRRRTHPWGP